LECFMPRYKIAFANFPGDGKTAWQTSAWCTKTFHQMKQDSRILEVSPGYYGPDTPITMLRNRCVYDAINEGADYLLMIDSDISPDSLLGKDPSAKPFWETAWEFMMRRRESGDPNPATIAAPYVGPPPMECPYIFIWKNFESNTPNPNYKLEMLEREAAAMRTGIERVAALPTGLILYDVRTFHRISKPWFAYEWTDEHEMNKASTEDVYETRNADLAGCPQYVAWDCWCDHIKTKFCTKPIPWTMEVLAEKFHESIISGRSNKKKLMFLGDPVSEHDSVEAAHELVSKGYKIDGQMPSRENPNWSGRGSIAGRTDGFQGGIRPVPVERRGPLAYERLDPSDRPQDESGLQDRVRQPRLPVEQLPHIDPTK
jgi:hypothetical protein